MKTLLLIVATYALFVFQTAVAPQLAIGAIVPNGVFPALAILALKSTPRMAICCAGLWGFVYDGLGTGPLGVNVMAFTLLTAAVLLMRERREMTSWASQALLVLAIATAGLTWEFVMSAVVTGLPQDGFAWAKIVGCTAVWSAVFGWGTLVVCRWGSAAMGRSGRPEETRRRMHWAG